MYFICCDGGYSLEFFRYGLHGIGIVGNDARWTDTAALSRKSGGVSRWVFSVWRVRAFYPLVLMTLGGIPGCPLGSWQMATRLCQGQMEVRSHILLIEFNVKNCLSGIELKSKNT